MRKIIRAITLLATTVCLPAPAFPWGSGGAGGPTLEGFSHPFVLTYPRNNVPTDRPRPSLDISHDPSFEHSSNQHDVAGSTSSVARHPRRHPSQ
jgi:hypothetical protein